MSKIPGDVKKTYESFCSKGPMSLETFAEILAGSGVKTEEVFKIKVLSESKIKIVTVAGQKMECEKLEEPKPKKA